MKKTFEVKHVWIKSIFGWEDYGLCHVLIHEDGSAIIENPIENIHALKDNWKEACEICTCCLD